MVWKIQKTSKFEKQYRKLQPHIQKQCDEAIDTLRYSDNPRMLGKRVVNRDDEYRYRFGGYRLIYTPNIAVVLIDLLEVSKRERAY